MDPESEENAKIKLIMLDPSCSGSGMLNHIFMDNSL